MLSLLGILLASGDLAAPVSVALEQEASAALVGLPGGVELQLDYVPDFLASSSSGEIVAGGIAAVLSYEGENVSSFSRVFVVREGQKVWEQSVEVRPSLSSISGLFPSLEDVFVVGSRAILCFRRDDGREEWWEIEGSELSSCVLEGPAGVLRRWLSQDGSSILLETTESLSWVSSLPPFELNCTSALPRGSTVLWGPEGPSLQTQDGQLLRLTEECELVAEEPRLELEHGLEDFFTVALSSAQGHEKAHGGCGWLLDERAELAFVCRHGGKGPSTVRIPVSIRRNGPVAVGSDVVVLAQGSQGLALVARDRLSTRRVPVVAGALAVRGGAVLGANRGGEVFLLDSSGQLIWHRKVLFHGTTPALDVDPVRLTTNACGISWTGDRCAVVYGSSSSSNILCIMSMDGRVETKLFLPSQFAAKSVALDSRGILISGVARSLLYSTKGELLAVLPILGDVSSGPDGFVTYDDQRLTRLDWIR